jgi:hypothetical protein
MMGNNLHGGSLGKIIPIGGKPEGDDQLSLNDPLDQLLREGLLAPDEDEVEIDLDSVELPQRSASDLIDHSLAKLKGGVLQNELQMLEETQKRVNYYLGEILRNL